MAKKCRISNTMGQNGHRVSHANNKTNHIFQPNLQPKRVFLASENRWVRIKVSTRIIRTIDKIGLDKTLRRYNLSVKDLAK